MQKETILPRWGKLSVETLAFEVPEDFPIERVIVTIDRTIVKSEYTRKDGRIEIALVKKQVINKGHTLAVAIHRKSE